MTYSFFNYLLESSICLLLFIAVYRLLISNLTHFSWMRIYLVISVILSLLLPLIVIPFQWNTSLLTTGSFGKTFLLLINQPESVVGNQPLMNNVQSKSGVDIHMVIFYTVLVIYCAGLFYKAYIFARNLKGIQRCIKQNPKIKEDNYWFVNIKNEIPAFSFFHYIFINSHYKNLTASDLQLIKNHEIVHVKQYHSLDILFIELTAIVFWFNPFMNYLKRSLQQIHEYIVDEKIAGHGEKKKAYAQLLLNLASETKVFSLSASFTGQQIKRRILMVTKPRSLPRHKLMFTILIPLTVFLSLSFSFIKSSNPKVIYNHQTETNVIHKLKIGEITWVGNTVFSTDTLNKVLGLKKGDEYNHDVSNRLMAGDVGLLYFDKGYVFYKGEFVEKKIDNGVVDLTISVYEGIRGKIGIIAVKGNATISSDEILKNMKIKSGDLFNKTKIVNSVHAIGSMDKFVPDKIKINVIPDQEVAPDGYATINLEFLVTEK